MEFYEIVMSLTRFELILREDPQDIVKTFLDKAQQLRDRMDEISEREKYQERIDYFHCDAFSYEGGVVTIIDPAKARKKVTAWQRDYLRCPCERTAKFLVMAGRVNACLCCNEED